MATNHRQFYQFKLLVLLLALLALVTSLSWVITSAGGVTRLQALLTAPTPTAAPPTLSAVERVARTATAEAQATQEAVVAVAGVTQTAQAGEAAAQATATAAAQETATMVVEVQTAATETTVAMVLATQTAKAMTAAEEATPTPSEPATETPTSTPAQPTPTAPETVGEATPTPSETPVETTAPEGTATPPSEETPEAVAAQPQEFQYTVRYGDTVTGLARRFGTTVDDIVQRNNLADPNVIRAGQTLTIFGTPPAPPVDYVVQRGDTLWSLAVRFNTTVHVITRLNHIANPNRIWVGQTLRIIPGALVVSPVDPSYTVKRGDTLWAIALRHGTTPWAIAIANNLLNPHLIFPGQVLYIP